MTALPIAAELPRIQAALAAAPNLVLQAPPGAGKTTGVPPALLDAAWLAGGKIVVVEPRRLAARAAARRMAAARGEAVGETVGYRVRLDTKVGPRTRIELVTDGLFLRRLQADPSLPGIGAVLFDEIHERSLDVDLALALCREAQAALRPDLRLVAMSATLEGEPIARLLGGAPILTAEGRAFPVETRWLGRPPEGQRFEDAVAAAIRRALGETTGDVLVFLPGAAEIRRVGERLAELEGAVSVVALHGDLDARAQDAAIAPSPPGQRKVVLATSIAETSLTIEGVRAVVDGGLARVPAFEPATGMSRLETVRVTQAGAEQRRGRAGRTAPGVCYRLWSEAEHRALAPRPTPEILAADLAPLALELALWGARDAASLAWLDLPPAPALAEARALLVRLGALDDTGAITSHGRAMAGFGAHPRLAHMMLTGRDLGAGVLAADLAALLEERDAWRVGGPTRREIDLAPRLAALAGRRPPAGFDAGALDRARRMAAIWRRHLGAGKDGEPGESAGVLVALAYPDRIAQRRGPPGSFRLANGRGAVVDPADPLAAAEFLAVADLDGDRQNARVFRAAALTRAEIERVFAARIATRDIVEWDAREAAAIARRRTVLDALVLADRALPEAPADALAAAVLSGIRALGLTCLPWTREAEALRARVGFLRRLKGAAATWPDFSDAALLDSLEAWLAPFLGDVARRAAFKDIPVEDALKAVLGRDRLRRLDREAPTHWRVPSGRVVPLDYAGEAPVLAARIQELFGATETPSVAGGRVPLVLHLLSPAGRPIQVTRDLVGFWRRGYAAARADLRGRYPRHYWPDDPTVAEPTSRAKPRAR
jgi:ATP-dependent helicase HrpB